MKNKRLIIPFLILGCAAVSCNKDFLERLPQTEISPEAYFKTPKDLETYIYGLYDDNLSAPYDDNNSDNVSGNTGGELDKLVRNTLDPTTVGGWDNWNQLRNINFLLDNVNKAQGDPADINHFVGIARYFRARFYSEMIARYSDVPWYSRAMNDVDPSLYKGRDPRAAVADSVLADLQFAVDNIRVDKKDNGTRVNKFTALALMSRFCLFEGTFRRYQPELKLDNTADTWLKKAVWAADQIMTNGGYEIYNTGRGGADYRDLFSSLTLSGNKEIIQWRDYPQSLGKGNNTHSVLGWTWSLSQSLVYSYLMKDGTPFTSQPGYDKMGFVATFKDRDPRLAETVSYPGFSTTQDASLYIPKPNLGAYDQLKFYPRDPKQRGGWDANYTALPVYRYAEVLLNFAEAKAELGELSQADLDKSVNLLRRRVQMPDLNLVAANGNPDPVMSNQYTINNANKGVLLEIRRERRVELACEGLRLKDINRWRAGARIKEAPAGMYVPALGGIDMSGDGVPDIAILPNTTDTTSIAALPADVRAKLNRFYLVDKNGAENNFYLENGTSGHILFASDRAGRVFKEPQFYYRPIPKQQTVLNDKLKQIMGW
ncbi:RagB/SusD family nutrient uptake outer membrane protein [Chitinophaga flava]|uniref:RagB/SusD family nutrient uptake outer membrane protein n=1 Tax=Chitinophaga flava TaxID=2259036 RepID=A0A365XYV1_9BACT|nr:RagB/SusD family nutrient uptake outer membrane protein [Chitinophaga flava]RBL90864.1 RagB/SusD family nutrient uptake outer membrane protein [Chitinophaga flava]